jgi:DNA primase
MPRIAEQELKRLKEEISVARLVQAAGIVLQKSGKDEIGVCPFHADDTASLVVTASKNLYHCFGCGAAGGPIDWVIKTRGVSFRHAVELLREGLPGPPGLPAGGVSSSVSSSVSSLAAESATAIPAAHNAAISAIPQRSAQRVLAAPVAFDADDWALMNQVAQYYHATLKSAPEALAYLQARGFAGESAMAAIDTFQLGYANRTLGLRLPTKGRKDGQTIRARLEALGVYRDSGHEHLNGSLVVPLFMPLWMSVDAQLSEKHTYGANVTNGTSVHGAPRQVVNFYGRKIRNDLRVGTPLHLYLPNRADEGQGGRRGLFNLQALLPGVSEELIVCEAVIDALTFWCAGFRNVTTAYGVEGVTGELMQAIGRMAAVNVATPLRRVLIAFDRDEAGERGAVKFAQKLLALGLGLACYRIVFPKGMDANEYALKVQPADKSLGLLIRKAQWMAGPQPANEAPSGARGVPLKREQVEPIIEILAPEPAPDENHAAMELPSLAASLAAKKEIASPVLPLSATLPALPAIPALPAAAVPSAGVEIEASLSTATTVTEREIVMCFGDAGNSANPLRRWRVRGLPKNLAVGVLKVNVMVSDAHGAFHVDTLDLYAARARAVFVQQAAIELGTAAHTSAHTSVHGAASIPEGLLKLDLGRVLLKLEGLQDEAIAEAMKPKGGLGHGAGGAGADAAALALAAMSEAERTEALALLQSPNLLTRIVADFEACGVVGETTNKLVGYLAAVSRLLERPLAVLIQSSSAAGKSALMDAVLACVPEEARVKYSAMTGQSLFYMGETNLKHRILAIAEEEGASRASYALKLLQSEGELTIASTGSDPTTGNLITQQYRVEGPTMLMMTTTAIDIDEELLNRCLVLTVDENRTQTAAIHRLQREKRTLAGLAQKQAKQTLLKAHQNAQRLLRPLAVVNPYAQALTFLDDRTRTRRDHEKYLTLIDVIALLHQYQREVKTTAVATGAGTQTLEYIEATIADIDAANAIAHEVLGRSLDELPPQTRRVLAAIVGHVQARAKQTRLPRAQIRFTRRELREATQQGDTQMKLHLARLTELEYLLVHRAERGQGYVYELLFDGGVTDASATLHLSGLIDTATLSVPENRADYDKERSGLNGARSELNAKQSPPDRGEVGARPGGNRARQYAANPMTAGLAAILPDADAKPSATPECESVASYGGALPHPSTTTVARTAHTAVANSSL